MKRSSTGILRPAAFLAGLAFVLAAPAGASVLHAAAHRSGLAAAHAKGSDRHLVASSGVDAGVQTRAPSVALPAVPRAPVVPGVRAAAALSVFAAPALPARAAPADSRAPPA
ncbi:MAG: hypothetical protein HY079_10750 [Elusimicrobia bacterium]|nr:hypothetical protein [Elusimicrobiota bacterium]